MRVRFNERIDLCNLDNKQKEIQDLKKAKWYLNRRIHQLEANSCTALVAHQAQKTCCCCGCWELHSPNIPTHHILQALTE